MRSGKKNPRPRMPEQASPSLRGERPEKGKAFSPGEASSIYHQILENSLEGLEFPSGRRTVDGLASSQRKSPMFVGNKKADSAEDESDSEVSLRVSPEDLRREMEKIKQELKAQKKEIPKTGPSRLRVTSKGKSSDNNDSDGEEGPRLTSSDIFGALIDDIESGRVREEEFTAAGENIPSSKTTPADHGEAIEATADKDQGDQIFSTQPLPELTREDAEKSPPGSGKGRVTLDTAHASGTNQYQLLNKIAAGGMAEVWKAKLIGEKGFEKIVAIKKILPHLGDNEEFIAMFIDEAKVAANLTHPNIAQIYELGKMADSFFIAMEYVSGHNLRTLFNLCGDLGITMPPEVAAFIGMKLCNALHYAHNKKGYDNLPLNIVHRDVSPQNILVSTEGEIKLVDFGIAKASIKATETIAGSLKGKLLYMSPEQADGKPIDKRSDIFSLSNLLFEALTGRKLFLGDSELSILKSVRQARIPRLRDINPAIPPGLEDILLKTLSRDPDQRYEDAKGLENAFKEFLKREKIHINEGEVAEFARLVSEGDISKLQTKDRGASIPPPRRRRSVNLPDHSLSAANVKVSQGKRASGGSKVKVTVGILAVVILAALALWLFVPRPRGSSARAPRDAFPAQQRDLPATDLNGVGNALPPIQSEASPTPKSSDEAQDSAPREVDGAGAGEVREDEELKRLEAERLDKLEQLRILRERSDSKKDN